MFNNLILSGMVFTTILTSNPAYSGATNTVGGTTKDNKVIEIKKDAENYIRVADASLYKGKITEITKGKDGMNILVSNLSENDSPYESLIFHINKDTKLNLERQKLKVGDAVDIFYSGAVTRSIPGQATAIAVNKVQETFAYEGDVTQIIQTKYGKMVSVVSKNKNAKFEEIVFNVNENTKFDKGSMSDLKVGAKVKATYGPVMTMSLPPQTAALSIKLLK